MLFFILIVIPTLGVLWFINLTTFLKNLKEDKHTHRQTVLGGLLTFLLIFAVMIALTN